jgi:hypothetical protein
MVDTAARLDQEILRFKRQLVREDTQGHTCEQCKHIRLTQVPEHTPSWDDRKEQNTCFRLDTKGSDIRGLAASGCNFWSMIWNKLKLIELEEKFKKERDNVTFDRKKHRYLWSDTHYQDLAASLGGVTEKEFLQLHKSAFSWVFCAGGSETDFSVTQEDFVRVIIRYDSLNVFKNNSVSAEVVLILPSRPSSTAVFRRQGDSELEMAEYRKVFLLLPSPGEKHLPHSAQHIYSKMCSR